MTDFDIDPGRIAEQAARLRDLSTDVAALPDLTPPDTGETAPHTVLALGRLAEVREELATSLADLAARVDQCLAAYAAADGEAGSGLALLLGSLS